MFKKRFVILCNQKGVPPTVACQAIGLSNATFSKWDDNSIPRQATLQKFADYFGVSVDYLLGKENEKKPTDDGELGEDIVIFHRDGKTQKRKLTKEQMDMLVGMLNAIPEDGEGL